ncbi:MAG TPA: T9SS type A sorting domain-containing protein [Bacteroidales bacterium]|nr:T9SS type A sorting domain-containing protein [Bacteroidales bacterium]
MKRTILLIAVLFSALFSTRSQSISDPFFEQVNYHGAFGSSDWTSDWCNWDPQNTVYPATNVTVNSGDTIKSNTTWTSNNTYLLNGWIYVKNNATLTIQPGTVIRGDYTNKGALIIERGSKLIAEGTSSQPIVFTSNEAPGNRDYGDWGGIILCGKSLLNITGGTSVIEGGPGSIYGGGASPLTDDSSGVLKYIRIEFPGVPFVQDKEINGLTLGAVGSKTVIDFIQVSYCGDDAFEWFGGNVNCKHLVSFKTWDDDFDTDNGYSGMLQFGLALRDPAIADPGSGSNGFESDNDANSSINQPLTKAVFSNFSMFGPKVTKTTTINTNYKSALHLRRSTAIKIFHSVFAGYKDGLKIEGATTDSLASLNQLSMQYCHIAGISGSEFVAGTGVTMNIAGWYLQASKCNDTLTENSELMVTNPFNHSAPNFLPLEGSPLLNRVWLSCEPAGLEDVNKPGISGLYPNPAQGITAIDFELSASGNTKIEILDITGRSEKIIQNGYFQNGRHHITFDVSSLNSGVWLVRISAPGGCVTKKLIVYQQ